MSLNINQLILCVSVAFAASVSSWLVACFFHGRSAKHFADPRIDSARSDDARHDCRDGRGDARLYCNGHQVLPPGIPFGELLAAFNRDAVDNALKAGLSASDGRIQELRDGKLVSKPCVLAEDPEGFGRPCGQFE